MTYKKSEKIAPNMKDSKIADWEVKIDEQYDDFEEEDIQIVSETRIMKGYGSIYESSPSRENKKWFASRRF